MLTYFFIFALLLLLELAYFRVAERFNIVDRPNERSSHSRIVLRGGGVIILLSVWIWSLLHSFSCPWFLLSVTLASGVSFVDDIRSLPDRTRLIVQFLAMALLFYQLDILHLDLWWVLLLALFVFVGASNVINFMDGINGITGAYAMAVLIPVYVANQSLEFADNSLILTVALADTVFCLFNFRPKGKARCFAGDVGAIGIAYVLLFLVGGLILTTGDVTYLIFMAVYGVDGCLTILHRIMLHENLGQAHRKHAYQIMANELHIGHLKVAAFYALLQMMISLGFVLLCPDTVLAHVVCFLMVLLLLSAAYVMFMKKYYYLHEAYLSSR